MRLKLDLHPIYNDSRKIEESLQRIIEEAVSKRAKEVEIIPGKGSGALKKSVIRFLLRPEIKSLYHRMEKDSDNWGRLFLHFRHDAETRREAPRPVFQHSFLSVPCACCGHSMTIAIPEEDETPSFVEACSACDSPNRVAFRRDRRGAIQANAELDYEDA